jgi:hypothetical protein
MALQDWSSAGPCRSGEPRKPLELDDVEQMLRIGEATGQMPLVFSQLSKQLLNAPRPRRRMPGMLMYPLVLVGLSIVSSMALPWMLDREGIRFNPMKAAAHQAEPDDDGRLVLNATCIMGDKRLAIINGRTYRPNDTIVSSNPKVPPCVVVDILPNQVLLTCQGKRLQLCYADRLPASSGTSPAAKPNQTAARPDLPRGLEGDGLSVLLEKMQSGEATWSDMLPVLSTLSKKKEKE